MLRSFPLPDSSWKPLTVHAIDNQLSEYRTMWINDTIITDGVTFLQDPHTRNTTNESSTSIQNSGGAEGNENSLLLLVYPQATGDFTEQVLKAYKGDTIVVAGTQNKNGFTGFQHCVVDEWVEKNMPDFELTLRMVRIVSGGEHCKRHY